MEQRSALDEGIALFNDGRFAEAVGKLEAALRSDPTSSKARAFLAAAYGQQGNLDAAVREFSELTRLEPGNPSHYFNLGRVYQSAGNQAEAINAYRKALAINPDYQKARAALSKLSPPAPKPVPPKPPQPPAYQYNAPTPRQAVPLNQYPQPGRPIAQPPLQQPYQPPSPAPYDPYAAPPIPSSKAKLGNWFDDQAASYPDWMVYLHLLICQCPGLIVGLLFVLGCQTSDGKAVGSRLLLYSGIGMGIGVGLRVIMAFMGSQ